MSALGRPGRAARRPASFACIMFVRVEWQQAGSPADFGKCIADETEKRTNVVKYSGEKKPD
jgi:hypothetical protein